MFEKQSKRELEMYTATKLSTHLIKSKINLDSRIRII